MSSKRTYILLGVLLTLFLGFGFFIYTFKHHIANVYENTIKPITFQNVVLEEDTALTSTYPIKKLPIDSSSLPHKRHPNSASGDNFSSDTENTDSQDTDSQNTNQSDVTTSTDISTSTTSTIKKGKEIKASDIPSLHDYNSRVRLTTFLSKFDQGDYITGTEFANLYRRDPSIGHVTKSTICSFIESHIQQLSRSGNSFIIQTIDPNGIHIKLKIPFVEDLKINIDNGAQIIVGETFTSKVPNFNKSILVPIQLQQIDIVHNGEQFPTNGYISGDFYFIDYSATKMAYKLK